MPGIRSWLLEKVNLGFGGNDGKDLEVGVAGFAEAEPSVVELMLVKNLIHTVAEITHGI